MSWGKGFKDSWGGADESSRKNSAALATGADGGDAAAFQQVARDDQAGDDIPVDGVAQWVAQQPVQSLSRSGGMAQKAAAAYQNTKKLFSKALAGAGKVACPLENWAVSATAFGAAAVFGNTGVTDMARPLLRKGGNPLQKRFDGLTLGRSCKPKDAANPGGVMPSGCRQRPGSLPQVTYVNGINTTYAQPEGKSLFSGGICMTMQELANFTCTEVTGVYNSTEGFGKDLNECLDNIAKSSNAPAVTPLRDMMVRAARHHQPMTLFAHSQGGLITQEAVAKAKQQLMNEDDMTAAEAERALGVVSIKSFGTATMGWPKGPHYERFTNTADPVPSTILGAQTAYPVTTWKDSARADKHHVFTKAFPNPADAHSMEDVYLPQFKAIKGAPHCACKGT